MINKDKTQQSQKGDCGSLSSPTSGYVTGYTVRPIKPEETYDWLLNKHYAKRIPSISWAYGLYDDNKTLQGVVSYGTPASSTLLKGVCGKDWANNVIELNRLCINENTNKNKASMLVSRSMQMLPKPKIIVSYADTAQGHIGYIYQATNFIYTGLSSKFRDPKVRGLEHQHHATYAHGKTNEELRLEYGDKLYFIDRPRKHRYIYFIGNKREVRQMRQQLRYDIMPYPKGNNERYDASYKPITQQVMF